MKNTKFNKILLLSFSEICQIYDIAQKHTLRSAQFTGNIRVYNTINEKTIGAQSMLT